MAETICAVWSPDSTTCEKAGRYTCKSCQLVAYCGPACQKAHWAEHKIDCRSPLGKAAWQPQWVLQNRQPAFIGPGIGNPFGGKKYLWGNMPAIDILKLADNEGVSYKESLSLLFAASGDLRNVLKTVVELPAAYTGKLKVTINDLDLDVTARNAIMLLIAFVVDDPEEAVDCIIHTWYSCLIRTAHNDILQQRIRPLIQEVCDKIRDKNPDSMQAKTWKFGKHSLRLMLKQSAWSRVLSYTDPPTGINAEKAVQIRQAVTIAASRIDYRDRHFLFFSPSHRIAKYRFRKDGLLLPFGTPRGEFVVPNPTLFATGNGWPLYDDADPLSGWAVKDVDATSVGPASEDLYGKLSAYLHGVLRAFLARLSSLQSADFHLLQVNAIELPSLIGSSELFDRIEVSNISDCRYAGPHLTVGVMGPLLKSVATNPHATLITLFMNAVDDTKTKGDRAADAAGRSRATDRLTRYMPPTKLPISIGDVYMIKSMFAMDRVAEHDMYFDRFAKSQGLAELGRDSGFCIKEKHTVIAKWPHKLKLRPGQLGAQEEFERCLRAAVSSKERYVEWKKVPSGSVVRG
ncbi:DUF4470 domain-containing protein [Microdochium nivale]|nr:DUF4470 domain-containing protein [Microdochium nivale]